MFLLIGCTLIKKKKRICGALNRKAGLALAKRDWNGKISRTLGANLGKKMKRSSDESAS